LGGVVAVAALARIGPRRHQTLDEEAASNSGRSKSVRGWLERAVSRRLAPSAYRAWIILQTPNVIKRRLYWRPFFMLTLLIVILVILLVSGGGFYGRRASWGSRGYLGLVMLVLVVILAVWVLNELLMPPLPMPAGVPSISK
jgi:hypothetical protein